MRRLHGLSILMILTILGITAFQLYWLKETYDREEKTLAIKTDVSFREVVRKLQAKKLNIESIEAHMRSLDPGAGRIFISNRKNDSLNVRVRGKEDIVSTLNIVRGNWKESKMPHPELKERVIISLDQKAISGKRDSMKFLRALPPPVPGEKGNYVMQFLYDVDSLQDSVRIHEIEASYRKVMSEQKINIPFTVLRLDSTMREDSTDVSVGLAHPVVYRLQKGSNVPYLLKRMSSPILFSLFLSALTILSFVLLFRNLKKQQRLAELKNDFISNITHELKTPIATVGVAIEALKNFNAIQNPERTKEYLDISSNELQRLNLLVDKVLKLSMFEKKEIELNFETINLKDLVDEVLASMRLLLDKKKAVVSLDLQAI
jgi:two-component system phosphate regulon sensor histidine kinase PhoR